MSNLLTACPKLCMDHRGVRKEKGLVNRKSICVDGFSEIVPCLVERYLPETDCCIMKGYFIALRICTYHRNDSLSFAFVVMVRSDKPWRAF
jgi:hypothetical protein